ncbi:MAG: branched-chain amino acid transport system substrate-binding protein [Bacteroidetes bacterium]|nr:MAG: branched-chain amino acid transport system substrate-binding protein [Bacteroidota bacterium]
MQKIGILLPRSSYYNSIGFDMFEGLRAGLDKSGHGDVKIVTENIGFGADRQQVYRSAEKLLLEENAGIILAYVGHRTAQMLRPLFMSANRLLIVLDAGANLPQEWPVSPNMLYHSLHNSLGAYLAGRRAFHDGFVKGGMVSNYYDGGYLHIVGITNGFADSGGAICFNHATGHTPGEFKLDPLADHLKQYPDACLLPVFSGDFNEWFFRDMKALFPEKLPPMYVPPFAFEEMMLSNAVYPGDTVRGIAAWSKDLENAANKTFTAAITEAGREANLFSLLGWEGAFLAVEALAKMKEHKNNARSAGDQLKAFRFQSPRGEIYFASETNTTLSPMYEAHLEDDGTGHCRLKITGDAKEVAEAYSAMTAASLDNAISGWFNSYTCN